MVINTNEIIQQENKTKNHGTNSKSTNNNEDSKRYAISPLTIEKTTAAKVYFEQYFDNLHKNGPAGMTKRKQQLEKEIENKNMSNIEKRIIRKSFINKETIHMRSIREKMSVLFFFINFIY